MIRLTLCLLIAGCSTTQMWSARDHRRMVTACGVACNQKVLEYTPKTGVCKCKK